MFTTLVVGVSPRPRDGAGKPELRDSYRPEKTEAGEALSRVENARLRLRKIEADVWRVGNVRRGNRTRKVVGRRRTLRDR